MEESDMTALEWNKKGDEEFDRRNWSEAISHYTKAIELATDDTVKGWNYDNRAAAYFELRDYDKAIEDCDSAMLKIFHNCPITLIRKFLALIELEKFDEAYQHTEIIISSCSYDTPSQQIVAQFRKISHEHIKEKVSQMMDLAFNVRADKEKRENAMITLLILARWRTNVYEIFIKEVGKDDEGICSAIRIVGELCKNNVSRIKAAIIDVVLPWCLEMMNNTSTERVNASQYCLQIILNTYSGMNDEPDSEPDEALCKMHKEIIYKILLCLLDIIVNETTTGIARDALMDFITRNIHYTALDWAKQLIEFGGLKTLMEVASLCQSEYCNLLDITPSTQTITSVCLAKIDENLDENDKEEFFNVIYEFIREEVKSTDVGCHVNAIVAMITLTFGPFNVANTIITEDGFYMIIVNFWNENNLLLQKVICEFIYVVVTKYDEFITFIRESLPILEKLFYSKDPDNLENLRSFKSIQFRAFVNICKMNKFEEIKYFQAVYMFDKRMQIIVWLEVCRQFLNSPQRDMRKWAVAGLSYLTFNIKVKKKLIEDREAVQAIIEFAKTENQSILYQVDILLVNLCSAYDKEDLIIERKTFVDYFHLEKHIRAKDNCVGERRRVLAHAGVISALVSLAKMDSPNSKELIARVFNAICSEKKLREVIVVEESGTETLLSLALDGTDKGKKYASRALVHLALTIDLKVAFPGQLIMEVIQPIVDLLSSECSVNEKHNALTALYNLASVNDSMRKHIFKTKYENIDRCMHDNENLLKRMSIKLTNNLVSCCEVAIQLVEQRSDQLHELIMWSMVHDTNEYIIHTKIAAAGMFVTLTATSEEACKKLVDWKFFLIFLRFLLNNPDDDLQHKGTEIALNMMNSTKDVAAKLIETNTIMKRVRELSDNNTVQNKKINKLASLVLEIAAKWDIIEKNVEGNKSSNSTNNTD